MPGVVFTFAHLPCAERVSEDVFFSFKASFAKDLDTPLKEKAYHVGVAFFYAESNTDFNTEFLR